MSLAAESPLQSSSSGEDFAAFLDSELELASSESSPNEENVKNDKEIDLQEQRYKLGLLSLHKFYCEFLLHPLFGLCLIFDNIQNVEYTLFVRG